MADVVGFMQQRRPSTSLIAASAALGAFALSVLSGAPHPAAAATTIVVDSTADPASPATDGNCTLREAVQAANTDTAVDGCPAGSGADTITLPAGTFTMLTGLRVSAPVTFVGANSGLDARNTAARVAPTSVVLDPPAGATTPIMLFEINCVATSPTGCATPVGFDGVDLSTGATTASDLLGIVDYSAPAGMPGSAASAGVDVRNSVLTGFTLGIYPSGHAATITANVLRDNNRSGAAAGNGIYNDFVSDGAVITDNLFDGNDNAGITYDGTPAVNANVSSNLTIADNQFVNGTGNGIVVSNVHGAIVTGNYVSEPGVNGITVASSDHVVLTDNTFAGGRRGIRIRDAYDPVNPPNSTLTISGNRIVANTEAGLLIIAGSVTGSLTADGNWWGANGGPGSTGGSGLVANGIVGGAAPVASSWITIACPAPVTVTAGQTATLSLATGLGGTIPSLGFGSVWYPAAGIGDPLVAFSSSDTAIATVSPAAVLAQGNAATNVQGVAAGTASVGVALDQELLSCPIVDVDALPPATTSTTSTTSTTATTTPATTSTIRPAVLPATGSGTGMTTGAAAAATALGMALVWLVRRRPLTPR